MGNDIIIGEGTRGQTFKIPPISYFNGNAKLYYIWFLDGSLVHPQSVINPKNRDEQIINLTIDEHFYYHTLEEFLGTFMIGLIFWNFMFQMFSMISLKQDLRVKKTMKIMLIGLCLLKKKGLSVYGYQSSQPVFAPIARPR